MRLKDKVAIVTGAGKGIGSAIAKRFAQEGAKVVIATRSEAPGRETERAILDSHGEAFFVQTDVAKVADIERMVSETMGKYGQIDILVNNAGITVFKPLLELTEEDWDHCIDIDLKGTFFCSKAVIPHMQRQEGGSIINISSVNAHATIQDAEMYAAAKSGVNGMTRGMSISFGPDQIRVNAIAPGFTNTPHYQNWLRTFGDPAGTENRVLKLHPLGKIVESEEVASLAVYLGSDESKTMTGSVLYIDAGLTAMLYND